MQPYGIGGSSCGTKGYSYRYNSQLIGGKCDVSLQQELPLVNLHLHFDLRVCMYVRTYVRTYLYIYVSMYLCIYVSMYLCIYVSMYLCMYVCIYLFIYLSIYLPTYLPIYIYIPAPGLPRVCFGIFSRVFMMAFMFISWYLQDF